MPETDGVEEHHGNAGLGADVEATLQRVSFLIKRNSIKIRSLNYISIRRKTDIYADSELML